MTHSEDYSVIDSTFIHIQPHSYSSESTAQKKEVGVSTEYCNNENTGWYNFEYSRIRVHKCKQHVQLYTLWRL